MSAMAQSTSTGTQDALALLMAKRDAAAKQVERLDALIAGILAELGQEAPAAKAPAPAQAVPPPTAATEVPAMAESSVAGHYIPAYDGPPLRHGLFFGLGLSEAGARALSMIGDHDHPKTLQQLWSALRSTGYTVKAADPIQVLSAAMRKRAKRDNDVVLLGNGEWGMSAWYTSDEIVKFLHNQNGKPGRNNALHSERTRQGMKQAALERGVHVGRPRKISPEMAAEAERMLLSGATVTEVCTKLDVSPWTLGTFFHIRRKENRLTIRRKLDDSCYAAPPPSADEGPAAQLRLVQ